MVRSPLLWASSLNSCITNMMKNTEHWSWPEGWHDRPQSGRSRGIFSPAGQAPRPGSQGATRSVDVVIQPASNQRYFNIYWPEKSPLYQDTRHRLSRAFWKLPPPCHWDPRCQDWKVALHTSFVFIKTGNIFDLWINGAEQQRRSRFSDDWKAKIIECCSNLKMCTSLFSKVFFSFFGVFWGVWRTTET